MNEENQNLGKREFKVDALNDELYYKNKHFDNRKRRKIHGRNIKLEHDFKEDEYNKLLEKQKKRKLPPSLFKKIFFASLFFFIITSVIAALSLYEKKEQVSSDLISMEILGQPFVDGGEPLELQVRIQNFNEQALDLPDLVLSYPKDSNGGEEEFLRRALKPIGKGQRVNEKFELTLYGQEGDVRNIHATLEYRIKGSNAIFVKEADHEVIIRSTPTQLSIDAPDQIVQNQEITLKIDVVSNSNKQVNNLLLKVEYPLGFEFISSNIKPDFGLHTWYFPHLTDKKQTIEIVGKLAALPGQGQSFHAFLGKQNALEKNTIETLFNKLTHTVDVQQSFITADLDINGQGSKDITIRGGDEVEVMIHFKNTLSKTLADAQIVVHIDGELYTPNGMRIQGGDFDSNTRRITWNKNSMEQLEFLEPGEEGEVSFALNTKELVGTLGALKNPSLELSVDVSATEINGKVREAFGVSRAVITANSDLKLITKTLYHDGPFKNSGPLPPRVGKKTKYTITLQVTNSSNEIKNAQVRTFLPPYVTWLNRIAPSVERQNVSYNETTREIVWSLGTLKPGLGIGINHPKQVSFQVEVLPSLSHADEILKITKDVVLSGEDSFTGVKLNYKKIPLSTKISDQDAAPEGWRVER